MCNVRQSSTLEELEKKLTGQESSLILYECGSCKSRYATNITSFVSNKKFILFVMFCGNIANVYLHMEKLEMVLSANHYLGSTSIVKAEGVAPRLL